MVLHNAAEAFADNWTYLKAELHWLDRLLMLTVARQRKEIKDLDRLAQSKADRVTSHWWKGVIALDTELHDEIRKPSRASQGSHQQQIDARTSASLQQGVALGLPLLRDRLKLSLFEKNLILLAIAPEINRRYARLYRFLQDEIASDLPTVDLALRLLCRTDQDWRDARSRLGQSLLRQYGLLRLLPADSETLLAQTVQLDRALIDYVLADQPSIDKLESLVQPRATKLNFRVCASKWDQLVLPPTLLRSLKQIVHQQQTRSQLEDWGVSAAHPAVLLTGAAGTGKTRAAEAIAHALLVPLTSVDLAIVEPEADLPLIERILSAAPVVLLITEAQLWFGRSARLSSTVLTQLLRQRQQAITLLETRSTQPIRPAWQQQFQVLHFPLPSPPDRQRLWRQAFPAEVAIDRHLPWAQLAKWPLTGGQIGAIAAAAMVEWVRSGEARLGLHHIDRARQRLG
ncbi:AAA family ATPase [Microcoleus sp. FACHB-1515]|uniref:AAA family ATPase n=1 Tax=Cyanophyceae TaxID=3028117 RepID=UPI001684AB74|nr:AAA family ATPase [Microcoleus sp. FACHB-1515]MBD2092270.1 AAA family ATPase [Microcoleus sp. FACHB-1515]